MDVRGGEGVWGTRAGHWSWHQSPGMGHPDRKQESKEQLQGSREDLEVERLGEEAVLRGDIRGVRIQKGWDFSVWIP